MLGFLGSLVANPLARAAGGWILDKVGSFAKSAYNTITGNSTVQAAAKKLGPTVTSFVGQDDYNNTMRKFGNTIQDKAKNSILKPVADGVNIGDAFYNGMTSIYNFMRNGGSSSSSSNPSANSVEKAPDGSQTMNDSNMQNQQ